jgi:flagellar protein FliJ
VQKFEFSLERLLKIRRQQERLAELDVMRALSAVDSAKARVEQFREKLRQHTEELTRCVGRTMAPHEWAAGCAFSIQLGHSITLAQIDVGVAEKSLAEAKAKRSEVASEAEAMQSLRDQQYAEFKQDLQKFDQERVDEAGLRRWMASAPERE